MYYELYKHTQVCLCTIVGVAIFVLIYFGGFFTKYSVSYEDCPIVSKSESSVVVSYDGESYTVPVKSAIPENADSVLCTIQKSRSTSDVIKVVQHQKRNKRSNASVIALCCCSIMLVAAAKHRCY